MHAGPGNRSHPGLAVHVEYIMDDGINLAFKTDMGDSQALRETWQRLSMSKISVAITGVRKQVIRPSGMLLINGPRVVWGNITALFFPTARLSPENRFKTALDAQAVRARDVKSRMDTCPF